jgi:aspartyl-tRNA(Asn)/glutamyl-tRNA(Gln) amidotransferase subunit C
MIIDGKQINDLAELAQIELGVEEAEAQRRDLERISTFAEKLAELDTGGMPCQSHPFGVAREDKGDGSFCPANRFREDEVTNGDRTEEWMRAAPDSKGSYFRVPRTVEE